MIKFFRKIRHKLLVENRFSKYLFYASGEIVLVVIGILIALWINNLNSENQQNKEAFALILSLEEELISNQKKLIDRKAELLLVEQNFIKVLNYSANKDSNLSLDSIRSYISKSLTFGANTLSDSRILSARSSGKFRLLPNDLSASFATYENSLFNYRKFLDESSFLDENWFDFAVRVDAAQDLHNFFFPNDKLISHPYLTNNEKLFKTFLKDPNTYKKLYIYYTGNLVEIGWMETVLTRVESTLKKIEQFKESHD